MRRRNAGLLAFFTIAAALFYLYRDSRITGKSHISFSPFKTNPRQGLHLLKSPKSSKSIRDEILPTHKPSVSPTEESEEALCWKKINKELSAPHFFANNRHFLNQHIGDWYFSKDDNIPIEEVPTPEGKFILALARAGLLEGKKIDTDDEKALKLLGEVSDIDPKNSAPFLFAAIIESRRGNQQRAEELLKQARGSELFDSYITTLSKAIFSQVRTPSDLLEAYGIWSTLPVPNYLELRNLLNGHDSKYFAHQLTKEGLDNRSSINDIEWFPLEYSVGKSLLDILHPQNKLPTYREILKMKKELSQVNADKLFSELQSTCDISSLNPMVDLLKKRLAVYR